MIFFHWANVRCFCYAIYKCNKNQRDRRDPDLIGNLNNTNVLKSYVASVFDFGNPNTAPGLYKINEKTSLNDSPVNMLYGNVLVLRNNLSETLTMVLFPYDNSSILVKSGSANIWNINKWRIIELNTVDALFGTKDYYFDDKSESSHFDVLKKHWVSMFEGSYKIWGFRFVTTYFGLNRSSWVCWAYAEGKYGYALNMGYDINPRYYRIDNGVWTNPVSLI